MSKYESFVDKLENGSSNTDEESTPLLRGHSNSVNSSQPRTVVTNPNSSSHTSPLSGSIYGYEEFHGGELPCPSCKGSGRIPRELENHLVALIPVNDNRLKPRKTKLYVSLAVFLSLLTGGLVIFFLVPRSIDLMSDKPYIYPIYSRINVTGNKVELAFINYYNVSNSNFFAVTVNKLSMHLIYDQRELKVSHNESSVRIGPRSRGVVFVHMNVTLENDEGVVAKDCMSTNRILYTLYFQFQATVRTTYLGHEEGNDLKTVQKISCFPTTNASWPTLIPPTHKTTHHQPSRTTHHRPSHTTHPRPSHVTHHPHTIPRIVSHSTKSPATHAPAQHSTHTSPKHPSHSTPHHKVHTLSNLPSHPTSRANASFTTSSSQPSSRP